MRYHLPEADRRRCPRAPSESRDGAWSPSVWQDRRFRSFWAGQTISQFGDRITELALPLIAVTALDASANEVAWLVALVWTPNLLAIGLGAWVDRHRHQRRLMVSRTCCAASSCSVPIAYVVDGVSHPARTSSPC